MGFTVCALKGSRVSQGFVPSLIALLLLLAFAAPSQANEYYINGHWYVDGSFVQEDIYIVGGSISRSAPEGSVTTIDLRGRYVIPPLAEGHNHNLQNPWLAQNFSEAYERSGILYAMMLCGSHHNAAQTRQILAETAIDVQLAGACVSSSDGHPLRMALNSVGETGERLSAADIHDHGYIVIDTIEDIEQKWPLIEASQSDIVKIIMVHSEREERREQPEFYGINGVKAELVAPLTQFLHARGLRVVAHVDSADDFATAVQAGVDFIGHLPGYRFEPRYESDAYKLSDNSIRMAAENGTVLITTASVSDMIYATDPDTLKDVQALQKDNLNRLHTAGVRIIPGSDRFDANVVQELIYLAELDIFTTAELLTMATEGGATALFPQRAIGSFREDNEANFVVLNTNPLTDLTALSDVHRVVKDGKTVYLDERTDVTILGVSHAAQLFSKDYRPAYLRAWVDKVDPDVVAVELTSSRYETNTPYGFTYEIQDILLPYAEANGIATAPFDWEPSDEDSLRAFRIDLQQYPLIRPDSNWGAFIQFDHDQLNALHLFLGEDREFREPTDNWASKDTLNIHAEAARRLYLYRTHMQARKIEDIAAQHPGGRIAVVVGYMHQPDLERLLASNPRIKLTPASQFGMPEESTLSRYEDPADLLPIAWINLMGAQSRHGLHDPDWLQQTLASLRHTLPQHEYQMLNLRFTELSGQAAPNDLILKWQRIAEELDAAQEASWTGLITSGRIDSDYDAFARLSLKARAWHEVARLSCQHQGADASMESVRAEVLGMLDETYHEQYLGYWEQRIAPLCAS